MKRHVTNRHSFHTTFRSFPFYTPKYQPKFMQDLRAERSYLLNSLKQEDFRVAGLLKQIRNLEDALDIQNGGSRKARGHLKFLKKRMDQCTKQEQIIIARLGQVAYEIQTIERLWAVEHERLQEVDRIRFRQLQVDMFQTQKRGDKKPYQWSLQTPSNSVNQQPAVADGEISTWPTKYVSDNADRLPGSSRNETELLVRASSMINLASVKVYERRRSMPVIQSGCVDNGSREEVDVEYIGYFIGDNAPSE